MKRIYGAIKVLAGSAAIASATYFLVLTKEDREEVRAAVQKSIKDIIRTKENVERVFSKNENELDQTLEALQDSVRKQWTNLEK